MRLARRRPAVVPAPVWRRVVAALIDLWPLAMGSIAFVVGALSVGATLKVRRWWIGEERDASWHGEDEDEGADDGDDEGADDDDDEGADEDDDEGADDDDDEGADDDDDEDENAAGDAFAEQIAPRPVDPTSAMSDGQRRWMVFFSSWQWRAAATALSAGVAVRLRNRRTRGARAMGIRRAEARTGGPVSMRSALIAFAIRSAWRELARRVVRGPQLDAKAWTEIRARHTNRGVEEHRTEVRRSRLRAAAQQWAITVAPSLSILWTARRQSIPDWLAGIVVVSDDS